MRADRAALTLGQRLGQGSQGTVYEVLDRKINAQWDVAFKEYEPDVLRHLDSDALTAMAELIGRLPGWDAAWLGDKTAWPAELVEADGAVTGFLMRSVPHRFCFDLRTPSGTVRKPTTMEFLLNDDAYAGQFGLQVSERDRLLVLADLADTLARLHSMDIVVGELSPKNLLFTTGATPECFLIGCDAMRLGGAQALPQVETPGWQIPRDEQRGTPQSDAYNFALLAVRVFARDQTSADLTRLAAVSPALADLARAGLYQVPANRPVPSQWAAQLRAAVPTAPTVVLPPPPPPPHVLPFPPQAGRSSNTALMIGLGVAAAGVLALVLVVVVAVVLVRGSGGESSNVASTGSPSVSLSEPSATYTPEPTPTETQTPYEEPFNPADLDDKATDTTPLTPEAVLPESFTSAKGIRYTLRASGVDDCPESYHDSNVRSALNKARCTDMITGAYINPNATKNSRIMVAVWVVPLKNDERADTAYSRLKNAYADDWGIVCPRNGAGSGLCDSGSWIYAQTYGWTGYDHRYLIHTMAIYTNRTRASSAKTWLKDASRAAFKATGPMVYHDND